VTPIKRPREPIDIHEPHTKEPIDAYKVWLANLQAKSNRRRKRTRYVMLPHSSQK
jgi:hypothetical protein